jgi:hypothetical protein
VKRIERYVLVFRVQGVGFHRFRSLGSRVKGLSFRVQGSGLKTQGVGRRV